MSGLIGLELSRSLRDVRYVVLAIAAPAGFYLLFAGIFSGQGQGAGQLPASVEIMVAMATFGAMWGALSATAPRLARDREGGWLRALQVTPIRSSQVLAARIVTGLVVALPALIVVGGTAVLAHHVRLDVWQWATGLGLLWAGTLPFAVLGIAIGAATTSTTAYALTTALYFALAALGGLWVPPAQFPDALRSVAAWLPSYQLAQLGWHVAAGGGPPLGDVAALIGWTAVFVGLVVLAGRRHGQRHRRHVAVADRPPGDAALRLVAVDKRYGTAQALHSCSLTVGVGQTAALLGPNGAGKSTAIAALLGLVEPDRGIAELFGTAPRVAIATGRVGAMLQDCELMTGVRVGALLRVIGNAYPQPADLDEVIATARIGDLLQRRTDQLSAGEAQRVRFALSASGDPELLVLDEPTVAMDVEARKAFWGAMAARAARGITIVFSTHYLEEADTYAERILVLGTGRLVADGTPQEVKSRAGIRRFVRFSTTAAASGAYRRLPGVTAVRTDGDRTTLVTADADATIWALYPFRTMISDLEVQGGGLEDALENLSAGLGQHGADHG